MNNNENMIDSNTLKKSAAKSKDCFAEHNFFVHEIADRLVQRLELMKIKPKTILDCGARDDYHQKLLKEYYPEVTILRVEHGEELTQLPMQNESIDLVFANLNLHWSSDIFKTLKEFRRILKKDGLLLFSTVGPDTLKELAHAFLSAEEKWHVHPFMDMHHLGDELVRLQFYEPVIDMEILQLRYETLGDLFSDLKNSGARNIWSERSRGFQGKTAWLRMLLQYEKLKQGASYPATFEIIYGQAWVTGPPLSKANKNGEVVFPIHQIQKIPNLC